MPHHHYDFVTFMNQSLKGVASLGLAGILALASPTALLAVEPLGIPDVDDIEYPDDEPHSEKEIELGKKLFFETRLSHNNKQSCATCHNPDLGFGDGLSKGIGTMGTSIPRNTPHIYNLGTGTK